MYTILLKDKQECTSFKVIYTDSFKITEKCLFYSCAGNNRVNKDDLLLFLCNAFHTTNKEHELITSHFIGLDGDNLIKCTNGDLIRFDYDFNRWIVNDDTFINGDDVKDAISSIIDECVPHESISV